MIHNIRDAFNEILEESVWMDKETKAVAKEKVNYENIKSKHRICISWSLLYQQSVGRCNSSKPQPVSNYRCGSWSPGSSCDNMNFYLHLYLKW